MHCTRIKKAHHWWNQRVTAWKVLVLKSRLDLAEIYKILWNMPIHIQWNQNHRGSHFDTIKLLALLLFCKISGKFSAKLHEWTCNQVNFAIFSKENYLYDNDWKVY